MKRLLYIVLSIVLTTISTLWLLEIGEFVQGDKGFYSSSIAATCGIPSGLLCLSFVLVKAALFKTRQTFSIGLDHFIRNALLALPTAIGLQNILIFLSPPFPFIPSLTCATNWNDFWNLLFAAFFLYLRYVFRIRQQNNSQPVG